MREKGRTREQGEGAYVRLLTSDKALSDKVYLAQDVPRLSSQVMNYIEQKVISCKFEDIELVTVSSSDGEYTLKAKPEGEEIMLENIPEGKKNLAFHIAYQAEDRTLTAENIRDLHEKITNALEKEGWEVRG